MSRRLAWILPLLAASCATPGHGVTPTFTYAPPAGTRYVRTVKIVTETSLPGSAFRQRVEREFVWNIGVSKDGDNTLVKQQLQRLAVRVNGADIVDGERVPGSNLSVDLVVDKSAKVVDVRGAEQAAELLNGLLRPGAAQDASDQAFTTEAVKEIAVARFEMVVRDLVGHPTAPGSSWTVPDDDPAVRKKTVSVDKLEACGGATCARVSAQYDVEPQAASRRAMRSGAAFLRQNGVNPATTEVLDTSFDARDELLVEPSTMIDHSATFSQTARVIFAGAKGQPIAVEFRASLEQSAVFP
jgi:hypothetical protein